MSNKKDNPVPSINKFIAMDVDGYYPDSIIEPIIFNTEQECVKYIKEVIYPRAKTHLDFIECIIVNDNDICYDTNKEIEYPNYRVTKLIENGVETNNEQPIYELEVIDNNATDNPLRIRIKGTMSHKTYFVDSLAWSLISNNQNVLHHIYTNFDCEMS